MTTEKIPRIIHYCWFGRNSKPEIIQKCIESWKKYCPEWEIKEWNEDNFDITVVPYMKEAYEARKWAFVSDVARLWIVYHHGGVYLDTDVELFCSIEELCVSEAFYAFETGRNINSGMGFGAIKNHNSVRYMLESYFERHFVVNGKLQMNPCPAENTEALKKYYPQFVRNGNSQTLSGIKILSNEEYSIYAKHHGICTWAVGNDTAKKVYRDSKIKSMLRSYRCFEWIEKFFGKKAVSIYTIVVYDLLEFGVGFYLKKIRTKIKDLGK